MTRGSSGDLRIAALRLRRFQSGRLPEQDDPGLRVDPELPPDERLHRRPTGAHVGQQFAPLRRIGHEAHRHRTEFLVRQAAYDACMSDKGWTLAQ